MPLLEIKNLHVEIDGKKILNGLDLVVNKGEVQAIMGPNGSGKSTLAHVLAGKAEYEVTEGEVLLDGQSLRGVAVEQLVRLGMAHVPEGRGVVEELTVDENLRLGGLWRKDRADAQKATDEVYELFEPLARRRGHLGHQLSGGERQMLAVGRALIARPKLLLLDEPSLGLAPKVASQIMALLKTLRDSTGLTVLLVEQNVRSALSIADQGVVMSLGRVVMSTEAATLRDDVGLRHAYLGF